MSSTSSAASADSALGSSEPECERSHFAKSNPFAARFFGSIGRASRSSKTSDPYTLPLFPLLLTLSAEGFPARTSALQGKAPVSTASAPASGSNTCDSSTNADRVGRLLKTSLLCALEDSTRSRMAWKESATPARRSWFVLQILERHTSAPESGLLPTPTAKANMLAPSMQKWPGHRNLWPTPGARLGDDKRGMPSAELAQKRFDQGKRNLDDAVKLWPTPTSSLGTKGGRVTPRKSKEGGTLIEAVSARTDWPTPTSRDWKSGSKGTQGNARPLSEEVGGSLNPTFVEWLMGYPKDYTMPVQGWVPKAVRAKNLKSACERCGCGSDLGLHHTDENRSNNAPENLETLCASCHTKHHWENGKQPWRKHSASCTVCRKPAKRLGLCETHRSRFLRHGSPYLKKIKSGQSYVLVEDRG